MIRVGVVSNPHSGRNRRSGLGVVPGVARATGALHATLDPGTRLGPVLADFARREVGLVVIDGGDGTVRAVLTAALAEPGFAEPPLLAALPSGTTNLIAGDVGPRGARGAAFARLAALAASDGLAGNVVRRAPIHVEGARGRAPELGFFFGAGALAWGTRLTRRYIARGRMASAVGTALGIAASAGLLLVGAGPAGAAMAIGHDEAPPRSGARTLFLATTLERLVLGLDPFWGPGSGPIRTLDIAAPARRFALALPALLRGRPRPWMAAAGYHGARAHRVTLGFAEDALLDGEWYRPDPGVPTVLRAGQAVGFVRP